ncbi:hypothetical protein CFE70_008803 [Pyrenophora teres f. teres 0-1]|uniref:Uncharacterized protein n=2 Tax=Pyrenophora teres f. teres TaxID=97479 RepID=E3RWP9_PYRTT|nr:hypothetical protein PTT_13730 [Pyrenophora teres f. teres 0-1]KAE8824820.1 hypothetical protein PTNB85_09584 [Pyrenophora teres f. teres]KAE8835522.1 hypothetical protein HRS9122_07792 [Pyrenophora teres f. teres]KAE8861741.1 hypothetical protein PTNB73_07295 [Pyrenophora teres f. teres]KAK1909379.1 hypothetical protein P3342_011458 [Pyrenophora teres f. teres]
MSHFHFNHTRIRERTPPDYEPSYSRAQMPRESNERRRDITLSDVDDDGHDDYPYSTRHQPAKLPRALTVRDEPSQLERYNVWPDNRRNDDEDERRRSYESRHTYRHSSDRFEDDVDDRGVRLSLKATIERSRPSHQHHHHSLSRDFDTHLWPSDVFRRKDRWVDEAWESSERSTSRERSLTGRDSWGEFEEKAKEFEDEKWSRYRKTTVLKTEEYKPLRRRRTIRDI